MKRGDFLRKGTKTQSGVLFFTQRRKVVVVFSRKGAKEGRFCIIFHAKEQRRKGGKRVLFFTQRRKDAKMQRKEEGIIFLHVKPNLISKMQSMS